MSDKHPDAASQLYSLIANEEDARVCTDISDGACHDVPRNFFLILGSLVLTKLGDLLISPKTVLAWLLGAIGAPGLVAWLVPIRESGSLIPQMVIGAWVRQKPVRKWFWVGGSFGQALSVAGMAASVWFMTGTAAGAGVIGCLILFSLGRGFCSVAMKDVQGKCVPKTRRGRLSGLATTIGGSATVALTMLLFWNQGDPSTGFYVMLLLLAASLWVIAGILFAGIDEEPGATSGGGSALTEAIKSLSLLRNDAPFRHFVITRALLLCSALASPYFVLLAQQQGNSSWLLGGLNLLASDAIVSPWFYPGAFFVLSIAHAGVRLGRKTYLVDMAGGNKRTDYTAVSNTVIGVLLLVTGGLSALASLISPGAVIIMLGAMGVAGTISGIRLKEVE